MFTPQFQFFSFSREQNGCVTCNAVAILDSCCQLLKYFESLSFPYFLLYLQNQKGVDNVAYICSLGYISDPEGLIYIFFGLHFRPSGFDAINFALFDYCFDNRACCLVPVTISLSI